MAALLALDLGDLIGADGTVFRTRRGELSLALDDFTLLAKSLRPPPDKHHGLADVETRHRHRELDLMSSEETRAVFITRAKVISAIRALPRRRRLRRGRDADAAADLRRRGRAAVRHAPQPARARPLPADRDRAVPQAADRRRARARLRDRQELPQRGRLVQAQPRVHGARVVRGLRGLRGHRAPLRGAGRLRRRGGRLRGRDRLLRAVAARDARRRDRRAHEGRHPRQPRAGVAPGGDARAGARRARRGDLGPARRPPAVAATSSPSWSSRRS